MNTGTASKTLTVRMPPEDYDAVMDKAHSLGRGFSVSALVRDYLGAWVDASTSVAGTNSTEAEFVCIHPKAALHPLGAGLARCGACGANRRADGTWTE